MVQSVAGKQAFGVACHKIDFDIGRCARLQRAERGDRLRMGNDVHVELRASTALTVRLTPSSVTEPLRAM